MFELQDLATIGVLVLLEGLLSADNALVMAIMVLGLPRADHQKALRYGLVGGFAFRILATLLAAYLISVAWVKLVGGLYLVYLTAVHFKSRQQGSHGNAPPKAKPMLGLSAFWSTVVRVEVVNLAFSIDSILVAVAMSRKTWVVVLGGVLGIVAMRIVAGQLIELIRKYPAIVDGAFVIIGWVGHQAPPGVRCTKSTGSVGKSPRRFRLARIAVIFLASYLYARAQGPHVPESPTHS